MSTTDPQVHSASSRISNEDHGAIIIITAGIVFGTTFMALCLRMVQRWPWKKLMKIEDVLLVGATVSCRHSQCCSSLHVFTTYRRL